MGPEKVERVRIGSGYIALELSFLPAFFEVS